MKHWYLVHTMKSCEHRVIKKIKTKRIEFYAPFATGLIVTKPLLHSFIFVNTTRNELVALKELVKEVINPLYWLNNPIIVKVEAIDAIKLFINTHFNIHLESKKPDVITEIELSEQKIFVNSAFIKDKLIDELSIPILNLTFKSERVSDQIISIRKKEILPTYVFRFEV